MTQRNIIVLSMILVLASGLLHLAHALIFRDAPQMLFYLVGDIAFLPLQVLFVTLIVDRLLAQRERAERRHKMNMVIGVFFSDLGRSLLAQFRPLMEPAAILPDLSMQTPEAELIAAARGVDETPPKLQTDPAVLQALRELLKLHEPLLLQLLANPVLLEHEGFTDALWAIQHLEEELAARGDLTASPSSDLAHLRGDAERAHGRLLREWLQYLIHLRRHYPYLFSFEVRADPLKAERSIEVRD